ncbi:MAG: ketosteroid isomerase-like protein [Glaciecola sp.]|jgi:ketosteroid isomerase-like protein
MSSPDNVVQRLYDAFEAKDGQGMQDCYAPDASFRDEVFNLAGAQEIGGMWKMLLARGKDLTLEVSSVQADATSGTAHWDATYTFAATKRKVVNRIDASFVLRGGLIAHHVDRFNFWAWSRQALGPIGLALGWTPIVRGKVRAVARKGLDEYLESN